MKRLLLLEDGSVFEGEAFGADVETSGEIVFSTGMTGYQESITDQSYNGQIITFTYPLIGNYGINRDDYESIRPTCKGVIVYEWAEYPSNWRQQMTLDEFLKLKGIPGISGIDTRALTKIIRKHGTMKACLINEGNSIHEALENLQKSVLLNNQIEQVSTKLAYASPGVGKNIVLVDFGLKHSILRELSQRQCHITVVPHTTTAQEILNLNPDGVLLSNGPGNPEQLPNALQMIQEIQGKIPIFGICMGHQLFAKANGAKTYKMTFGHRGFNHAVRHLQTGQVDFTSQNHGYAVSREDFPEALFITHEEINDKTVEGVRHKYYPAFSVQFHPDAAPGPHDTELEEFDMPKRTDIRKIMVIGSGPIVIGQAAEFDYSGTQACLSLKEEGYQVVLVNSNPATIMTDKDIADKVYIEPITLEFVTRILRKERPDALLPTLGGQTGLNMAMALSKNGILELLGTKLSAIDKAEDRDLFKQLMEELNQPIPESEIVNSVEEAIQFAEQIGYPLIVRPAFTLGGTGGGMCDNQEQLVDITTKGLKLSPVTQCLIERSIAGFKEIEYEVMRDAADNALVVCNMENFDPVGIHTGDSIVFAPAQTLSDVENQLLRDASLDIIRALKIEGGCNVQLALDPNSFKYYVIEVNPRVSRSSALASKATGYPIAKLAAKIAVGLTLDEVINPI